MPEDAIQAVVDAPEDWRHIERDVASIGGDGGNEKFSSGFGEALDPKSYEGSLNAFLEHNAPAAGLAVVAAGFFLLLCAVIANRKNFVWPIIIFCSIGAVIMIGALIAQNMVNEKQAKISIIIDPHSDADRFREKLVRTLQVKHSFKSLPLSQILDDGHHELTVQDRDGIEIKLHALLDLAEVNANERIDNALAVESSLSELPGERVNTTWTSDQYAEAGLSSDNE